MAAVPLAPSVWLVGTSDPESPAFTSQYDGAQYLVERDHVGYLIDSGTGLAAAAWLANAAEVLPLEEIRSVLLTHYHADHAGGAAAAVAAGLLAQAGSETAAAIRDGNEEATQVGRARRAGVYPDSYRLQSAPVTALPELQELPLPGGRLTVLPAPGHCTGHVVFLLDDDSGSSLFSGDVVFAGGRVSMQAIPDCRLDLYAETLLRLDELRIDRLFPGHGPAVLESASRDLAAAAASFRVLVPPPNFLRPVGFDD